MRTIPHLILLFFINLFFLTSAGAQNFTFSYENTIPLVYYGDTLYNAWAGGLNAGQYSTIQLNEDSVDDLVVFDRTTNKLTAFLSVPRQNSFHYQHAPQYETQFPQDLDAWVLLADYNQDGNKDIFTHTNLGIKVYQNTSTKGKLNWELRADPLETKGFSGIINLLVSVSDIPAIVDLDEDGDLDILTFDSSGDLIEYHQNLSIDRYQHATLLEFEKVNTCWGKFGQGASCEEFIFDIDCGSTVGKSGKTLRVQHTGSTLLITDLDGDGDKDLLNGHVGCYEMVKLTNEPEPDPNDPQKSQAKFNKVDEAFPETRPIYFPIFPAAFLEDVDFDGVKDLLATPNLSSNEGNFVNFRRSNWLYKNIGTNENPHFDFQQNDFLQSGMLDAGENIFPALADYDGDGDIDLFIGNRGNFYIESGKFYATMHLYENIGTKEKAFFELKTEDYLGLSALGLTAIKPSFVDINNDQVLDLVFASTSSSGATTEMKYMLNTAAKGESFTFSSAAMQKLPLPLIANDTPVLYDLDGDKDLDALVGKFYENLEYYLNTGTSNSPVYTLQNEAVGSLPRDPFDRNLTLTIADLNQDGKADLVTGDRKGKLKIYTDVSNLLNESFSPDTSLIWNSLDEKYTDAQLSGLIFPAAADLTNDGLPELLVGTQAGGIVILKNTAEPGNPDPGTETTAKVYPNPTDGNVYFNLPEGGEVSVFSVLGQQLIVKQQIPTDHRTPLTLKGLPAGVYLLKVISGEVSFVKKIVLVY